MSDTNEEVNEMEDAKIGKDDFNWFLLNIVRQIGMVNHDDLEAHVKAGRENLNHADSIGVMLDPTGWIRARNTGEFDLAKNQLEICERLLDIRKLMNQNEELRQEYFRKTAR